MTAALCFACGEIKFGALLPCKTCGIGPTDQFELDILFTDHFFSQATLERFGSVIKAIGHALPISDESANAAAVRAERVTTFLQFLADNHGDLLHVELPEAAATRAKQTLQTIGARPIKIDLSSRGKANFAAEAAAMAAGGQRHSAEKLAAIRDAIQNLHDHAPDSSKAQTIREWQTTLPSGRAVGIVGDSTSGTYMLFTAAAGTASSAFDQAEVLAAANFLIAKGEKPKRISTPDGLVWGVGPPEFPLWVKILAVLALISGIAAVISLVVEWVGR